MRAPGPADILFYFDQRTQGILMIFISPRRPSLRMNANFFGPDLGKLELFNLNLCVYGFGLVTQHKL